MRHTTGEAVVQTTERERRHAAGMVRAFALRKVRSLAVVFAVAFIGANCRTAVSAEHPLESMGSRPLSAYESINKLGVGSKFRRAASAVGQLVIKDANDDELPQCTGILISPQHFLTARHCLEDDHGSGVVLPIKAKAMFIVLDRLALDSGRRVELEVAPIDVGKQKLDFVVLRTKQEVPIAMRRVPQSGPFPGHNEDIYVIHHPFGLPLTLTRFNCRIAEVSLHDDVFGHSCDTQRVSSGAPILDFEFRLIGLHIAGGKSNQPDSYNQGLLLAAIEQHSTVVRESLKKYGQPIGEELAIIAPEAEATFVLQDGSAFVQTKGVWRMNKANRPTSASSSVLKVQDGATTEIVLWDPVEDLLYRVPKSGGMVKVKPASDVAWKDLGVAHRR